MKKMIIPTAVIVLAIAVVIAYAALLPSYGEKMRASVLRAPSIEQDSIFTTPKPTAIPGYVLVSSNGFEIPITVTDNSGMYIYDYNDWADAPYMTVYSSDGTTKRIRPYDLTEYQLVGWSAEMPEREGFADLKDNITAYISEIPGDWGAYVKRMDTNEYLSINEQKYSGASLIKLFTMAAVYNEIAAGSMTMNDQIRSDLTLMITESSNIACNSLTAALGGGDTITGFNVENRHTASIGCQNTVHESELVDGTGHTTFVGFNRTSPADCARIMELVYKQKLVNPAASSEMLDLLKRQERTWKIPESLPEGTVTANKTGETDTVEADAAIVYSPACDYVICVIGNGSVGGGIENIRTISRMTYDYFNK